MSINGKVKIVMAGINIVCLIVTLLYPNSATPFAVVPVIVTTTSWTLFDKRGSSKFTHFLVVATFVASICLLIGLTSSVHDVNSVNGISESPYYSIVFNEKVAFIGGTSFSYGIFVALILGFFSVSTFTDWYILRTPPTDRFDINRIIKSKIEKDGKEFDLC